jgi:putative membrane protein
MKKPALLFLLLTSLLANISCTDKKDPDRLIITDTDRAFLLAAADRGIFQINAGQLALTNEASPVYAGFAQKMIDAYSVSNQELQTYGAARNVALPNTISDDRQQTLDSLASRRTTGFDTTYAAAMVKSHVETITYFEQQANAISDDQLKSWISGKLPVLRLYLEEAKALNDSLN